MSEEKTTLTDKLKKLVEVVEHKFGKSEEKVKLEAMVKREDGVEIYTPADEFTEGVEVFVVNEEGETVPAPDGEHTLEDGSTAIVAEGKLVEIKAKSEEKEELSQEDSPVTRKEVGELFNQFLDAFKASEAKLSAVELSVAELKGQKEDLEKKLEAKETALKEAEAKLSAPAERSSKKKRTTQVELKSQEDIAKMSVKERIAYFANNPEALKK